MLMFCEARPCRIVELVLLTFGVAALIGGRAPEVPPQGSPPKIDLTGVCTGRYVGELQVPEHEESQPSDDGGHDPTEGRRGQDPIEDRREGPARAASKSDRRVLKCPEDWRWLFEIGAERDPVPPDGLQRFCVFQGEGDPTEEYREDEEGRWTDPADGESPDRLAFERIVRECFVVGPAGGSFYPPPPDFGTALRDRFLQQTGQWSRSAAQAAQQQEVRLVVIDSVRDVEEDLEQEDLEKEQCRYREEVPPAGEAAYECSAHGWALASLARDLLCDGGACAATITTRRTLHKTYQIQTGGGSPSPRERSLTIDEAGGGLYGSREQLAEAIRRAVEAWWPATQHEPPGDKLVLNLSVGWEEDRGGSPEVRAALEDAVCRGALVLAAAGNRIAGDPSLEKPLLPAAWEVVPAPTAQRCTDLLGQTPPSSFGSVTEYRPLLHAVGGIQANRSSLSNSRPRSMPRLAAFGDHAAVSYRDQNGKRRQEVLTGTSVSTVVVAAAAAAHWRDGSLESPFDVIQDLWTNGDPIASPVSADFCLESAQGTAEACQVKRIRVSPSSPIQPQPPLPIYVGDQEAEPGVFRQLPDPLSCDPPELWYVEELGNGAILCPQRWLNDVQAQPWLGPQPGPNHCPSCTDVSNSPSTLYLEFDPRMRLQGLPVTLSNVTLIVGDRAYRLTEKKVGLGELPFTDLEQLLFEKLDLPSRHPMYLVVTVENSQGKHAAISPILAVAKN